MSGSTKFRRPLGAVIASLTLTTAACGSTTETTAAIGANETEPTAATTSTSTTTSAPTTTAAPTTSTTATSTDEPVVVQPGMNLDAGVTYQTTTQVPFRFTVPYSSNTWMAARQSQWSGTIIFGNESMTSDVGSEPGFNVAVAEEGATPESVAEAMTKSREGTIAYERSDGLFEGRDAIILEGTYNDTEIYQGVPVLTGETSYFGVLFGDLRTYRSQIFEEQGRTFIVSFDCHPDDVALVRAEIAPVMKSLEIGDVS